MLKLCRDCKHRTWDVPNVSREEMFFANEGPWCNKALSRTFRPADLNNGGHKPLNHYALDAANVDAQRTVPIVFDTLSSSCGTRGRWFELKEQRS
jgi:hypothetical protein